jgi:AcrR family transcriptional regulator
MAAVRTTPEGRAQRERILRAALELFAARGYRGASIEAVAQEVGLTRQGVLHYFPSKVHLLLGVLDLRDQDDTARVLAQLGDEARLDDALLAVVRNNQAAPALARLFAVLSAESVDAEHPGHDWFRERYRAVRAALARGAADAQAAGELTGAIPPDHLAVLLTALMDGLQLQFLLDPESVDMVEPLAGLLALLGRP